jgi:hypothetical protein
MKFEAVCDASDKLDTGSQAAPPLELAWSDLTGRKMK